MILPFRVDVPVTRFPVVTVAVILMCNVIFWLQLTEREELVDSQFVICQQLTDSERHAVSEFDSEDGKCEVALAQLYLSPDPEELISKTKARALEQTEREDWPDFVGRTAHEQLQRMRQQTRRRMLTERLEYRPETWNPMTAVTAVFAHGGIAHLLGNLYFFFLFGSAVEMLLGRLRYVITIIVVAIGSHYCYSAFNFGMPALPTLGLSGVVYGMLGVLAWALPMVNVRYAYWFLIRYGVFRMPALFVAFARVGMDAYLLYHHAQGSTNMVAHVSSAILGALLAATVFRAQVARVREMAVTTGLSGAGSTAGSVVT